MKPGSDHIVRQLEEKLAGRVEDDVIPVHVSISGIPLIEENTEAIKRIIQKHAEEFSHPSKVDVEPSKSDWWRSQNIGTAPVIAPIGVKTRVTIADQLGEPVHLRGCSSAVARVIGNMIDKQILCEFVDRDKGVIQFEMPHHLGEVDIEFTLQGPDRVITVRKGSP